jgi:hypothetical protein
MEATIDWVIDVYFNLISVREGVNTPTTPRTVQ